MKLTVMESTTTSLTVGDENQNIQRFRFSNRDVDERADTTWDTPSGPVKVSRRPGSQEILVTLMNYGDRKLIVKDVKSLNRLINTYKDGEESFYEEVTETAPKRNSGDIYSNDMREDRIARYRKYARLEEDQQITEDTLDEYAISKVCALTNCDSNRLRAELLNQKWSDYER